MVRWAVMALVVSVGIGCASGAVVQQADRETLEQLQSYEVAHQQIQFDAAGVEVHGTVTRPESSQPVPGVVMVAGSGPTDRDWNNPLLPGDNGTAIELTHRLGEAGIATLRYDKRGTGQTELTGPISWSDYLQELEAAVATLRQTDGIDGDNIFVAGHSEGGAHVLRAIQQERIDVDGVILLGVAGRTMSQLVTEQVTDQLAEAGMSEEAMKPELQSLQRALNAVANGEQIDARQVSQIPGLVSLVETLQQENAREFAAEMLRWDPAVAIRQVDTPILVLHGLKDIQTDPETDGRRLYDAAGETNDQVELALVADADHVLKRQTLDRDQITPQHALSYNDPARVLDEAVLETIAVWVHDHTGDQDGRQ